MAHSLQGEACPRPTSLTTLSSRIDWSLDLIVHHPQSEDDDRWVMLVMVGESRGYGMDVKG